MSYFISLDRVHLPIAPSKIDMKIKNQNKTINLINAGEVNILKDAGLTEITFEALIPHTNYPFAVYPNGFKPASFFLSTFERLKNSKKPFRFVCSRVSPSRKLLFDTNMQVSLEDYKIQEDASNGMDLIVGFNLKEYRDYATVLDIQTQNTPNGDIAIATVQSARTSENAPNAKTYTVKSGDTLWQIAKRFLGNGSRYSEIYELNKTKIKSPNLINIGQVLTLPS